MNTEEQIEIVRANGAGKQLERACAYYRPLAWHDSPIRDDLNFAEYKYRIKEQLETVEVFVWKSIGGVVIVKQGLSDKERMDLFSGGWVFKKSVTIEV